ncbi:YccF domain-containing protein [Pseudidiomarina sediminum]|uniref:Inner membrane protein YccF n=1 Tax=Pseudidiomarina sediminum TaxID=431675 RepID=A0A432ZAX2_9GAMM|nr:YccF domain-containing protein [Pseudidiomarina sediminum]MBY6064279.1 YccF domain-containing protein [Pseudidiomarina sediminum]RUO75061.1 YccF domain-containing protein [Pseudidiomarina sediminum]
MALLGNILWLIFGGFVMGLGWWLAGLIAMVSIIGIPWAKACFVIGRFAFLPFGYEAISRRDLTLRGDVGTSPLGLIGNILWLIFFGWWLALGHLASMVFMFITIIGIPFGIQHFKLAVIALMPIGKTIVAKDVARVARRESAEAYVNRQRNK